MRCEATATPASCFTSAGCPSMRCCGGLCGATGGASPYQPPSQIAMYESELERAHGQMLEEMQAMEDEKNRAIEEAFSRAQVEMKAVHENLAGEEGVGLVGFVRLGPSIITHTRVVPTGVRTNLLTLQPALRTLTHDYNSLKRQVRDFPLLLQETLRSARAEVSSGLALLPPPSAPHMEQKQCKGVTEPPSSHPDWPGH